MTKNTNKPAAVDAITLLKNDHKKVKKLFADFSKIAEGESSDKERVTLVDEICMELSLHAQVEEEIFYPAVRAAIKSDDLMDEADVEHAEAKQLIAQLKAMTPTDDHYDAKITVLGENIDHHIEEEEGEMFPKATKAKVDMIALGVALAQRKHELQTTKGETQPAKAGKAQPGRRASTSHAPTSP